MKKIAIGILIFSAIFSMVHSGDADCEKNVKKVKDFMNGLESQNLAVIEKEGYYPPGRQLDQPNGDQDGSLNLTSLTMENITLPNAAETKIKVS